MTTPYQQGRNAVSSTWHWVMHDAPIGRELEQSDCIHDLGSKEWKEWHRGFEDEWDRRRSRVKRHLVIPHFVRPE